MNLRNLFKKKTAVEAASAPKVREHRGAGARKAARRKFRHALQNTKLAELLQCNMSPGSARFHARVAVDRMLAEGTTDSNAHGRGMVKR